MLKKMYCLSVAHLNLSNYSSLISFSKQPWIMEVYCRFLQNKYYKRGKGKQHYIDLHLERGEHDKEKTRRGDFM